jgi:hypothetical protein
LGSFILVYSCINERKRIFSGSGPFEKIVSWFDFFLLNLAFEKARFTDKKYLNEIGLPSFEEFLSILFVLKSKLEGGNLDEIFESLNENIDESGRNMIEFMKKESLNKIQNI